MSEFQSTFPQGERLGRSIVATMELSFQSTFPQGERRFYASYIDSRKIISIHVPTRGTTRAIIETKDDTKDFNPRSHKGNDICSLKSGGADPDISIHVPTRGTTMIGSKKYLRLANFNPRSHKGNDGGI